MVKLLVLALELKIDGKDEAILRLLQTYNDKGQWISEKNSKDEQLIKYFEKIKRLIKCPREDLLDDYEQTISETEDLVFKNNTITPKLHKAAILFKLSWIRSQIIRKLLLMLPAEERKHIIPCLRCQKQSYPNILLSCGHVFCKDCLSFQCILSMVHIQSKVFLVKCPYKKCNHVLSKMEIQQAIGNICYFYLNDSERNGKQNIRDNEKQICCFCGSNDNIKPLLHGKENRFMCILCTSIFAEDREIYSNQGIKCMCSECNMVSPPKEILQEPFCTICLKTEENGKLVLKHLKCGHYFCNDCIREHIKAKKSENMVGIKKLFCPFEGCNITLESSVIEEVAGEEILTWFEKKQKELESIRFTCPKCKVENCLGKDKIRRFCKCSSCNAAICIICNELKHPGVCENRKEVITCCYIVLIGSCAR